MNGSAIIASAALHVFIEQKHALMKQILPDSRHEKIKGAFVIDEAALIRLDALIRGFLGDEFSVEYVLGQKDSSKITSEDRRDLQDFPLHHVFDRTYFEICYSSNSSEHPRNHIDIKYDFAEPVCRIYATSHPKITQIQSSVSSFVIGTRAWYSPVYTFPMYWLLVPTWTSAIILLYGNFGEPYSGLGTFIFGLWILLTVFSWISRRWLFDKSSILFGAEVVRQTRRASVRRAIAMAFFAGIVVTAAGGYFQNLFAKPSPQTSIGSESPP